MNNLNLSINEEKCVHCGLCVKDCTASVIKLDENKIPKVAKGGESRCIGCQHCLAICPTGALSILDKKPENSEALQPYDNKNVLNLIQGRRSVRQFKPENLDEETMEKLKNMLHWVPTGCNNHKLQFSFIDNIDIMNDFRDYTNSLLIKIITKTPVKAVMDKFKKYTKAFLNGEDVIFRGAPHMVVVSVPVDAPCSNIDPMIALSYFELYAQSLGVGTLWCGFAQYCLQFFPELCNQLEIPDGYKASYVMLFGPCAVKYQRTTQPEPYKIVSVQKGNRDSITFTGKLKRYFWNFMR